MLKMASFLTEVPKWTQPPKPLQDGTDLIYYKSIVICLLGLFQETSEFKHCTNLVNPAQPSSVPNPFTSQQDLKSLISASKDTLKVAR